MLSSRHMRACAAHLLRRGMQHHGIPSHAHVRPTPSAPAATNAAAPTRRRLDGAASLASTIIGSPLFMSPELLSGLPYSYASDMWSVGCVLYEMLTGGRHAFDAATMPSLLDKVLASSYAQLPTDTAPELRVSGAAARQRGAGHAMPHAQTFALPPAC